MTVTTEIKKAIVDEMETELDSREYYFEKRHLNTIVETCIENKANLIDLFSKHPNWNPEKLMIQFDTDIERSICTDEIYKFTWWLRNQVNGNYNYSRLSTKQSREFYICNFIEGIRSQFFDERMKNDIDDVNKYNENFKLRTNMKSSKAIGKICREEGWDKLPEYNQKYAALCDCLSPLKIKRHTCISVNPIDYLLMSNGNSWNSCHYIGDDSGNAGCYSSGTISYMLDNHSFVFYTVDASYDGNYIEREPKIQRQMFGYNDEVLVQLRLYPQSNDSGAEQVYDNIRAIVQKVVADCLGKPNMWIKSKNDVEEVVRHGDGATCYPDWHKHNPGGEHCSVSTLKERANGKEHRRIIFGAQPICISCGHRHSYDENISCCDDDDDYRYCAHCGDRIYIDDVVWVGDGAYCTDCVTYCDCCGEYVTNDQINEIDGDHVCDYCLEHDSSYQECEKCGEYHHIDNMVQISDEYYYCEDCADEHIFTCPACGAIYDDNLHGIYDEINDCYYCEDCYYNIIQEREKREKEKDEENECVAI